MTSDEFRAYVHGPSGSCMKTRTVHERINMNEITADIDAPNNKANDTNFIFDVILMISKN